MDDPNASNESSVSLAITVNAILIAVFSFLGFISNIVPLIVLYRVRSLPAITMITNNMFFTFWAFIDVCIWPTDNISTWFSGHGVCDIQATLRTPMYTLLALSVCVLTRDLARALDVENPRLWETDAQRRRRRVVDILCIFALPVLQLPLHYVVQYNRYSIIAVYGCIDSLDNSYLRIILMNMWPLLVGILNCYYAVLTIVRLRRHQGALSSTLSSSSSGLDSRRFLKLFALAFLILIIYLPVQSYDFWVNMRNPFHSYSWDQVHQPDIWNQVLYFHTADFPDIEYWSWVPIALSFVIFIWYGLANEAVETYRHALLYCGFAKLWPKLKNPRQLRRNNKSNLSSHRSWIAKIDIFSKSAAYMDRSTKQNSLVSHDEHMTSASYSENDIEMRKQSKSSASTMWTDPDSILPVGSSYYSAEQPPMPSVKETEVPETVANVALNRNLFSAFRTHVNVPFPLFNPVYTTSATANDTRCDSATQTDLERQTHINTTPHALTTTNAVETTIWSDDEIDPTAPKMGTRAYRERERREMIRRENDEVPRVSPDDLHVDIGMGLPLQGELGGVKIKREFEQREEEV